MTGGITPIKIKLRVLGVEPGRRGTLTIQERKVFEERLTLSLLIQRMKQMCMRAYIISVVKQRVQTLHSRLLYTITQSSIQILTNT